MRVVLQFPCLLPQEAARSARDYPHQLRGSLAADDLARSIHRAYVEIYGGGIGWDELHAERRTHYRELALAVIGILES